MLYNEADKEVIRSLSWDEMKARMPTQAAEFFTQHHPLLVAYKHSLLGEHSAQGDITQGYFSQLPPDEQYGLVIEMGAMTLLLAQADLARYTVGKIKESSRLEEVVRFENYGVNLHISGRTFKLVMRAILDQRTMIRNSMNAIEDGLKHAPDNKALLFHKDIALTELKFNEQAEKDLLQQLTKAYPKLVTYVLK
jgi:hypothetical protein